MHPERLADIITGHCYYRLLIEEQVDGRIVCPACEGHGKFYVPDERFEVNEEVDCPRTDCEHGTVPMQALAEAYEEHGMIHPRMAGDLKRMRDDLFPREKHARAMEGGDGARS